jgi:hypothetical protein
VDRERSAELEDKMTSDWQVLESINVEIGNAEAAGGRVFFEDLLAPSFAFRRATGAIVDREQYIEAIAAGSARTTKVLAITFAGRARAVVSSVVTMEVGGTSQDYDNLRMFIQCNDGSWKLLAWANEPIS